MINKNGTLQILKKVYTQTLKTVPISGLLGIANYVIQGLFPAIVALLQAHLFDATYSLTEEKNTLGVVILYGVFWVASHVVVYILNFISSITINAGIYERCTSYYNIQIAEKMAKLPLIACEDVNIHNLCGRARDCIDREILSQIYMSSTVFITSAISVVTTLFVLASYSIIFIPISIFSVLPYFIARIVRGKEFYALKKKQIKKVRKLDYLWGLFHNKNAIKEMRVMGFSDYLKGKWMVTRDDVNEELWRENIKDAKSLLFCDSLKIFGYGLSVFLALLLVLDGKISVAIFGVTLTAFKAMQTSTQSFLTDLGKLPEKISFAKDFFSFIDLQEDKNGTVKLKGIDSGVSLKNVGFKYPGNDNYAIQNITLKIRKGEKIIVLGENGSGKTTLSKIIMNVYTPTEGNVYFDSIESSNIDKTTLYDHISIVSQNFVKYKLSLRENIAISNLGKINYDSELKHVIITSGLNGLNNLDQQVGQEFGGAEFSGGIWQKIAIARGLFRKCEFIILDEPTSALDPVVESEVLNHFMKLADKKTALIITHRVGLCKLADRIVVMKNGKICEEGTHQELIKLDGEYRRLYSAQEQWYR